ncbi:MAG: response regulator transcription factor [Verrucomicrobiota bacterium]
MKTKTKAAAPVRVMLVDDHTSFRQGLTALMAGEPDLKVVAEAGDGKTALEQYRQKRPDVVLMDLRLPGMGGVEITLVIRKEFPDARIIVLTTFETDEDIYRAIQSGAKSYLLKDTPYPEIARTVRQVHAGEQILPPKIASLLAQRQQRDDLSQRELSILELLVKGRSNKEIGSSLSIAEDTVKTHLKNLFAKLGVSDRTGAAITAIKHGIIHLE